MNFSTFKHSSDYPGDLSFRVLGFGARVCDTRREVLGGRLYSQAPRRWIVPGLLATCPRGVRLGAWYVSLSAPWT